MGKFITIFKKKLNLQSREVEICLEFLFKERIFKKSDLVKDSWDDQGVESMVSVGELRSLDFLIQEISNRKQEKLQKLSAIYELAKGDKKPEFYIESYFS